MHFRLPWNQKTLLGWTALILISTAGASIYLHFNGAFLSFFITICQHHYAFRLHFESLILRLNKIADANTKKKDDAAKQLLQEIVRFHVMAKQ